MKTKEFAAKRPAVTAAFSMIEVLIAVSIVGIMFVAMYAGLSAGFTVVQLARENLRATQILLEKMETIRLYRWEQINTPGFIPTNFTDVFYSSKQDLQNGGSTSGILYTGTVSIASAPLTEAYSNDVREVTIQVTWKSADVLRSRVMRTFVSRYGLQNYIY